MCLVNGAGRLLGRFVDGTSEGMEWRDAVKAFTRFSLMGLSHKPSDSHSIKILTVRRLSVLQARVLVTGLRQRVRFIATGNFFKP